ncbi:MAG: methyltransferase family protein [Pseudomonas sp.]
MRALENKIPPPIVTTVFALLMWLVARYGLVLDVTYSARVLLALLLMAVAVCFSMAGVLSFRQAQTTVNPLKPESASALVRSGIYQYSRNPMYVGFALLLLAWVCFLASPLALLGVPGFILYMNRFQISPEERALTTLFGREFQAYQAQVRRWL